jgi:hypothetical protein
VSNSPAHDQHLPAIDRYLRENLGCPETLIEPARPRLYPFPVWPAPDVVGFAHNPLYMTCVDVKVSRADSQAHLHKPHVENPTLGVGSHRYIAAPLGLLVDVPDGWGLLVIDGDEVREAQEPEPAMCKGRNAWAELWLHDMRRRGQSEGHGGKSSPDRRADTIIEAINGRGRRGVSALVKRTPYSEREIEAAALRSDRLRIVEDGGGRYVEVENEA